MFDDSCYMEPLHLAGRLIMENGGETCRVEETVLRMGHAFGFREVECFAVPSGLFVSYRKSDGTIETAVKRIRRKGIDLTRIDEVNAISRHLEQEKMSCQEVLSQLKAVERRPSRLSPLQMAGAAAMSTAGWSLMFGGGVWDLVTAFFVGLLIEWVTLLMDKFHMQTLVATLAGGFLAAFLPMAVNRLTRGAGCRSGRRGRADAHAARLGDDERCAGHHTRRYGIGHFLSGQRGDVGGAACCRRTGGHGVPAPADGRCGMSYEPLGQGLWYFLTSFVGTLGFAILLHAPKRAWLPASLIGAMTYTLYWSLKQLSLDEAASMFLAALFGSLLAQFCARKMRMIATIFLLLSVVALVPGLGLYRCMEQLGHQQYALGAQTGILTMAGILMMALGIGVGSFLFKLVVSGTKKIMPGGKQK